MAGNLKAYLAELIGTFALVFISAGSVCVNYSSGGQLGLVGIALAQGLILLMLAFTYAHPSGAHFNPAVTLSRLVARRIDTIKGVFYIISQLLGSVLAARTLQVVFQDRPEIASSLPFLGVCDLTGIGYKAATLLEALGAFFLVSATFVETTLGEGYSPFAAAGVLAACVLVFGPLTGAALNPARAFGPSVMTGYWKHWYVYWIGPLTGAAVAAVIYENLYAEKRK